MSAWHPQDALYVEVKGRRVEGVVVMASPCSGSLFVEFEAILDGHAGAAALLRGDDGLYRSIHTRTVFTLTERKADA